MGWLNAIRLFAGALIAVVFAAGAATGETVHDIGDRFCVLASAGHLTPVEADARRATFDCRSNRLAKSTDHFWMRADVADVVETLEEPVILLRMSRHRDIVVHTIDRDGGFASARFDIDALKDHWQAPSSVALPLPQTGRPVESVLVEIHQPWDPANWADIELTNAAHAERLHRDNTVKAALMIGLLCAPVLMNLLFFWVIRRWFMLFHTILVGSVVTYAAGWSGILFVLVPSMDIVTRSALDHLILGVAAYAACFLARNLCERGTMGPRAREALGLAGAFILGLSIVIVGVAPGFPRYASEIYHFAYLLPVAVIVVCLGLASVNGSISARVQLLGWSG
ncbi:MAG: 7TM diverse intracellular signaling domain-containing protein, partial [Pseudomonadota bacterium]